MDMSGMVSNDTIYTGSVCMSITVVGNTTNLPLSDPFCNTDKCLAFKAAHTASQDAVSYYRQYDYGYYTTWYYLAVLGVGMIFYAFRLYQNRRASSKIPFSAETKSSTSLGHKVVALLRMISYRSIGGAKTARWGMPRLGMLIFLLSTWLFFLLLTFYAHPYYRDRRGYGSPPLGVRTGLMSTALTPIIVALSGKVNLVTLLTGIKHEKLNILHRWAAILCLFLALVHTIPFIVQPLQKCGADGLRAQFYKTNAYEDGVPPLAMLVGLVVLSIPYIRHHFYKLFYRLHIPMYIVYLGTLFWHAGNQQDSWAYLWATLAIWLFSVSVRFFYKWQTFNIHRTWFSGFTATVQELPGDMTRVTVFVPNDLRWKPGQHCFIRMPHLSLLQNHPYTIANLPSEQKKGHYEFQEMEFYVRAHHGLTRNLLTSVKEHKNEPIPMHIDGPYGGLVEDIPAMYQSLVFVAGGSGITACLPHIFNAVQRIKDDKSIVTSIRLVWMVRHPSHTQWVLDELKDIIESTDQDMLHLDFFVTDVTLPQESDSNGANVRKMEKSKEPGLEEKQIGPISSNVRNVEGISTHPQVGILHNGRPYLPEILPPLFRERRVFVLGSGPQSLRVDLGTAIAKAQQKVLTGQADVISLSTEMFGW